jgi:hypothetical protein
MGATFFIITIFVLNRSGAAGEAASLAASLLGPG